MVEVTAGLKAELIEPVVVKGLPTDEDLRKVDALADAIAAKHAEAGLIIASRPGFRLTTGGEQSA